MLAAIALSRGKNVYIANVLKCRPPGNRNPEPDEVAKCSPHLLRQIALIQPKLILAMGRFAAQTLLGTDATIASLRGRVHRYAGVPLIVTYHPAYLLRNLPDKAKAWADLLFAVRDAVRRLVVPAFGAGEGEQLFDLLGVHAAVVAGTSAAPMTMVPATNRPNSAITQ